MMLPTDNLSTERGLLHFDRKARDSKSQIQIQS